MGGVPAQLGNNLKIELKNICNFSPTRDGICTPTDYLNKATPTRHTFFLTASPSCHLHWLDVGVCGSS